MESLRKVLSVTQFPKIHLRPDFFQRSIRENLYLEFFLSNTRALLTPSLRPIFLGDVSLEEEQELTEAVGAAKEKLTQLKSYLVCQLSLYSSLLETNSYFICLNNYLVICRFLAVPLGDLTFEVKLYTVGKRDLPRNYKDKLFLGRDFISLSKIKRDHLGLENIRNALLEQVEKLQYRYKDYLSQKNHKDIQSEYIDELKELVVDASEEVDYIINEFPADINSKDIALEQLLDINRRFREIKHILIDMESTTQELETALFDRNEVKLVHYATKLRKDITNYINYITFKVNGRISDMVNGVRIIDNTL